MKTTPANKSATPREDVTLADRVTADRFNLVVDREYAAAAARATPVSVPSLCDRSKIVYEGEEDRGLLAPDPDSIHATPSLPASADARVLLLLFTGHTPRAISEQLGISLARVTALADHPTTLAAYRTMREHMREDILQGTHGPVAMARAASNEMLAVILGHARYSEHPEVSRKSAIDVLAIAGYGPTRKVQTINTNEWWSSMTPAEIKHYNKTREWPARFSDFIVAPRPVVEPAKKDEQT